jgi:benzoylformate decarboxylase
MATQRPGRQAIFEQFAADGITTMFGNPGTVEQGFLDELTDVEGFRYILGLQETVAIGMADGYARASERAALVQLHSGVGLGNGIGMLYQALRGHSPLVVIAGEAGIAYDAMDAQMAADLVSIAAPVTKYATRVVHPDSVLRTLRRAVKIALTPPRGPVFVALPMDVLDLPTAEPAVPAAVPQTRGAPAPDLVDHAVRLLSNARRPVIIAGDGVSAAHAQPELVRVAETLGADVWLADTSEVNIDTTHPLYRGALGHMSGSVSAAAIRGADAVLIVGTYAFPEVFPLLESPFEAGAPVVHIDLNAYEIGKNHPIDLGLVADPKLTLDAIGTALRQQQTPAERDRTARRLQRRREETAAAGAPADDGHPDAYEAVLRELARRPLDDVVIFDEALTASARLTARLPPRRPGNYFLTRGGSLGVGIPGAIGVKLARPNQSVLAFVGDGGSMYTIQALWTARRYNVDAKFIICNNGKYELLIDNLKEYQRQRGISRRVLPESFALTPDIGFVEVARGLGVEGLRVDKPDLAGPAVEQMLAHNGPFLLDVFVDRAR